MLSSTHTYVIMDVCPQTFLEVRRNLEAADYQHAIHKTTHVKQEMTETVLDMHGIALRADSSKVPVGQRAAVVAEILGIWEGMEKACPELADEARIAKQWLEKTFSGSELL